MNKRVFAISTLLLIVIIIAIFVYNFAFKKPAPKKTASDASTVEESKKANENQSKTQTVEKPVKVKDFVTPISDVPVYGATLSSDGESLYYFSGENGELRQVNFDGSLNKIIATEKLEQLKKVSWNKPKNRVIIETKKTNDGSSFFYYDLIEKKLTPLKEGIDMAVWSNLGDKIIYKYFDAKTRKKTIDTADPNGKNWNTIAEVSYINIKISPIPATGTISFWPRPSAFNSTNVELISFKGEGRKSILTDKYGVDLLWSPKGTMAAVSFSDIKGGHKTDLALMNSNGGEFRSLSFPTFASKCTWSNDSHFLYCAMAGNMPETAVLPNDWQEGIVSSSDTFWKIDIENGKKERILDPQQLKDSETNFDAINPFLSNDEKLLFFVNRKDGRLYKISLP